MEKYATNDLSSHPYLHGHGYLIKVTIAFSCQKDTDNFSVFSQLAPQSGLDTAQSLLTSLKAIPQESTVTVTRIRFVQTVWKWEQYWEMNTPIMLK